MIGRLDYGELKISIPVGPVAVSWALSRKSLPRSIAFLLS